MEGFVSQHLDNLNSAELMVGGGVLQSLGEEFRGWGEERGGSVWAEEGQSGGVCLQLVLIMGLMWRSDLKHTLTLQTQVKAGYGFWEAPSQQLLYHSFPARSKLGASANLVMEKYVAMKLMGVSRRNTFVKLDFKF